ncbi:rhodanese-like domain-containing protein [Stieleria sp. TO1_6]|uniref:rhodanese-like domain-containing protein n=1 Tax=Stieleria tagensis TaxID=2956795 RepID=UPI00209A9869|nr:rhodanese-like domain-containing protein [Stieleria tagensis]MCO8123118.1 rhodanese-like domain-containing protein [Stieleria tagensis]
MRYAFLFLSASLLLGCSSEPTTNLTETDSATSTETIDPQTASGPVSESDAIVIDVRSQEEWDDGHVEQAVHIPHTEIADRIGEVTDDKNAKIVVYCAVGGRAGKAKTKLEELGFTNVENAGGYDDIKQQYE